MRTEQFDEAGIKLVDNTPEEITTVVMEMADKIERNHHQGPHKAFWAAFPRSNSAYNNRPLHGAINMRIGREFLKGYQ